MHTAHVALCGEAFSLGSQYDAPFVVLLSQFLQNIGCRALLCTLKRSTLLHQSRDAVLAKATEDMFAKWGTYMKGEVQVRTLGRGQAARLPAYATCANGRRARCFATATERVGVSDSLSSVLCGSHL